MLERLGFANEGFRTENPEFYARALEEAGYREVRSDATGDGKGAVLISGTK